VSEVTKKTLTWAYKPFDIVTDKNGDVGFIQEVNVNECQDMPDDQISYAVNWLVGNGLRFAWFRHNELTYHCNLFVKISESACHPHSMNAFKAQSLFNNINR